jgi:hypothetical protein
MVHERFEFDMPAPVDVVFDAFHYHEWRHRWDSLVDATRVLDGAPCPYVGAVTDNAGGGLLRPLSMQTEFISYERPKLAAAAMLGRSFPFARWAASMRHKPLPDGRSVMLYTYSFETSPRLLRWLLDPITKRVFDWQTRKRFGRMQRFLAAHAAEVEAWQRKVHAGGG